ncbi:MAG: S8 family serine peptidase [Solirubrobacterales bacterium]
MTANERRRALLPAAALIAALLQVPPSAAAMTGAGKLSPQLAALAPAAQRSASLSKQAGALGAVPGGGLQRDGQRVLAYVRFDHGAVASLGRIRAAGAEVVDSSHRYQTVTVAVKPDQLYGVSRIAGVASIAPVHRPIVAAVAPCFGAATSEGDLQLNAMKARDGFEVDGSGVKVGILSDSFNRFAAAATNAAADIASGDLPGPADPCGHATPTQVLDGSAAGTDEGRAMAQIVHDLAPGATLAFATAFPSELAFAKNIKKLAEAGAQVIVDDVFYPEEPFFQDGPVAVAVAEAVEGGVTYLSAAGNDNLIDGFGRNIASWEAPEFRDSGACPEALVQLSEEIEEAEGPGAGLDPNHCMDFDPGIESDDTFRITVSKGATLVIDLQWNEPRGGVGSDLDAYLLGQAGELLTGSIEDNASPVGTQEPVEVVEWKNDAGGARQVQLAINEFSGSESPRLKFALLQNGGGVTSTEYPESSPGPEGDVVGPTIFGHAGAPSAVSVGAVPYFEDEAPERYSSWGPVTHYFGPVTEAGPAEPLASPEVIPKPDVAATDGGANTFFGSCVSHAWRFFGTSAAAPHAAAVAALELQAGKEATPTEDPTPAEVGQALIDSAAEMPGFPPEAVGGGLVDAPEAIAALTETAFPGGEQFAPPVPQNCGFPPAQSPGAPPVTPTVAPPSVAHRSPRTFFRQRPRKVVRTRHRRARVVFRFGSNVPKATFACRVDSGLFRPCGQRMARRFPVGKHTVKVAARDAEGDGDRTPAAYRFRVKRVG